MGIRDDIPLLHAAREARIMAACGGTARWRFDMTQFRTGNTRAGKVTGEQVLDIRSKYAEGWSQGRLARHFALSVGQIGRIVRGEAWQELGGDAPRGRWQAGQSPAMDEAAAQSAQKMAQQLEAAQSAARREALAAVPPETLQRSERKLEELIEGSGAGTGLQRLAAEAGRFAEAERRAQGQLERLLGEPQGDNSGPASTDMGADVHSVRDADGT